MKGPKNLLKKIYHKLFDRNNFSGLFHREIADGWTILDVGCGHHSSIAGITKNALRVGLDHYEPYISRSRSQSIHNFYILSDATALPFETNSFDCALATEVLEHLHKQEGLRMIEEMERVAKKKILLTTPNGFLPTYPGPNDNPDEAHLSGWAVDELKSLGFKVYGYNGLKLLWTIRGGQAVMWLTPSRLPALISVIADITGLFIHKHSHRAFQLFFVKDIKK
jgi:SAM-dependent methyltransferase